MREAFHRIIEALRSELHEYGGLLHLFERQQEEVLRHNPDGFLALCPDVEQQLDRIQACRSSREQLVRNTATLLNAPPDSPLTSLLPACPEELRPLLIALIQEINDLLTRTQRRSRQNHMLLGQCLELARQMVAATRPEAANRTYSSNGKYNQVPTSYATLRGVTA